MQGIYVESASITVVTSFFVYDGVANSILMAECSKIFFSGKPLALTNLVYVEIVSLYLLY